MCDFDLNTHLLYGDIKRSFHYTDIKKNEIVYFADKYMKLINIILVRRLRAKRQISHVLSSEVASSVSSHVIL